MKTKVQTIRINNQILKFESDTYNGEILDTTVFINGYLFCVIAGNNIENFKIDFNTLITKYKI